MPLHLCSLRGGPRLALAVAWITVLSSALCVTQANAQRQLTLLSDPFLQVPGPTSVEVAWFTEFDGDSHHVIVGAPAATMSEGQLREAIRLGSAPGVRIFPAHTIKLSRVAEDADSKLPDDRKPSHGIAARDVYRHHAVVTIPQSTREPYRVVSTKDDSMTASATFSLRGALAPGEPAVIMLTSDHQLMVNAPANLEFAARTITAELGPIDAVFLPGDLVNVPDRASEWFDDERGSAFFPAMQGRGGREASDGLVYRGGAILQSAALYSAIGNHEVQGRRDGHTSLTESFNNPVPRTVAEVEYAKVARVVNPEADPSVKARWIENNSFSTTTYEEIFSLPRSDSGGERYYATTVGDVRLVTLFATRIWRSTKADPDPAVREDVSRYQEARSVLADPLAQGYGEFIFEDLAVGTPQYEWLKRELDSPEFRTAEYTVVQLHESPQSLGENAIPTFAHPRRIEERDGIRYEYPAADNILLRDIMPLLDAAGTDLVYNGHNHLWNRFVSASGVNYLEASNTGNSYGAYLPISGKSRPVPPPPWNGADYSAQGNPGGLAPIVPNIAPLHAADGQSLPYVAGNNYVVFQALHTGTGMVTSWYVDMADVAAGPLRFDQFQL